MMVIAGGMDLYEANQRPSQETDRLLLVHGIPRA